jgi:hypothetical protein
MPTTVLVPTGTISSLNFFANPNQDASDFHLNVDETNRVCVDNGVYGPDRIGSSTLNGRVKFRFTPPVLSGDETFYGVIVNACGGWDGDDPIFGRTHRAITAQLFLENTLITESYFPFPLSDDDLIKHAIGGWGFFNPEAGNVGELGFHEAIISAGLNPDTVNWSTLDVQFILQEIDAGNTFSIEWVALTIWQGLIGPTVSGGVFGGGIATVDSLRLPENIDGGAILSGEAFVGPFNPSGGIVVSPSVLATSIETRTPIGGVKVPSTTVFGDFVKHFGNILPDTVCFLSGGASNGDPLLSLGGAVSITKAGGDLFDDFQPEETLVGLEDYRCIYIYNELSNTIRGLNVWVESPPLSAAAIVLGVDESDDIQEVNLSFFSGIGTFTLDFGGIDVVISADSDLDTFAQNFQNSLRNDTSLTEVIVQAQMIETTVNFKVTFTGDDGRRSQPVFGLKNNSLGGSPAISIDQTSVGSPINATAESIGTDVSVPSNPEFRETTRSLPIIIPNLAENEGFPLWIKRTVDINPAATQNDGFFLQILTQPITIA